MTRSCCTTKPRTKTHSISGCGPKAVFMGNSFSLNKPFKDCSGLARGVACNPIFVPTQPFSSTAAESALINPPETATGISKPPNQFTRLKQRIQKDGHEISNLSFGKLRKTAADLIRRFSGGKVAGVFLCHGQPVRTDDSADVYTNRPFGKVFAAIRQGETHLQAVFEAAGAEPFPS